VSTFVAEMFQQFVKQVERANCAHPSEYTYPCVQFRAVQSDLVYAFGTVHDFSYMTKKKEMARIKRSISPIVLKAVYLMLVEKVVC